MTPSNTRTWQNNADLFHELDNGEGWPFAALVACSVQQLPHGGGSKAQSSLTSGKVGATAFATRAATTKDRVLRYLAAWEAAAAAGHCTQAGKLQPVHAVTIALPDVPFSKSKGGYYEATNGIGGGERFNATTVPPKITPGSKLATAIAQSAPALTALLNEASPAVVAAVLADVSDEAFEHVNEAIVAVTTPVDEPKITSTGVIPAHQPSVAKVAAVHKVVEAKVGSAIKADPTIYGAADTAVQEVKTAKITKQLQEKFPTPVIDPEDEIDAGLPDGALPGSVATNANQMAWLTFQVKAAEVGSLINVLADLVAESKVPFSALQLEAMAELIDQHLTNPTEALKAQIAFAH